MSTRSSFPSLWVGAGQQVQMRRPSGGPGRPSAKFSRAVLGEMVPFAWRWVSSPTPSRLAGLLPWPGWAGGSAKDFVS